MKRYRYLFPLLLIVGVLSWRNSALAQPGVTISDQGVHIAFPEQLTFSASIFDSTPIQQVVLEYGVNKHTCSAVIAKAFPPFTPGAVTNVAWTWAMRKSGSEPPGATLWYRWIVTDQSGATATSETRTILWLDKQHNWNQVSTDKLTLHWYAQSQSGANDLLNSASTSLEQLVKMTGVDLQQRIDIYLYGDSAALQNAVLYAPGWTGGLAFPDYDLLVIGIPPNQMEWGKHALAHELTHVLIGTLTTGCFSNIPTWLNEGIAVYSEGGPNTYAQAQFTSAIKANKLESIQVLSSPFSEDPGQANLAYSESYSLVNYLITLHSQDKVLALFSQLRQGTTIDTAFQQVYGYGLPELEQRWRKTIGAASLLPTSTVSRAPATLIPTYQPADYAVSMAPQPVPGPSDWSLPGGIGIGILLLGGVLFYVMRRKGNQL